MNPNSEDSEFHDGKNSIPIVCVDDANPIPQVGDYELREQLRLEASDLMEKVYSLGRAFYKHESYRHDKKQLLELIIDLKSRLENTPQ